MSLLRHASSAPLNYTTPPFPSLYWPLPIRTSSTVYLYYTNEIWRFTLLWTLLFYAAVHVVVCVYAIAVQKHNWKAIWIVPVVYSLIGGVEAVVTGSIVGALLGGVYNAGSFRMSTWIPFVWAWINTMVLILSSFAIQGGL